MADYRNTTETVDPEARAKFKAEMKRAGRPVVRRAPAAKAAAPKLSVMQTIWQQLDALAASLTGRRQSDMSGYGGRERGNTVMSQADAAVTGTDQYGRPVK